MKKLLISAAIAITVASSAFADPRVSNAGSFLGYEIPNTDNFPDELSNKFNEFTDELLDVIPDEKELSQQLEYTLVPVEPQCTNTDILIGVGTGLVVGTAVGVVAVVGTPVAMPVTATTAVLTGSKVTLTEAIKNPKVSHIIASNALLAPTTGVLAFYASCTWDPISNYTSSKYSQFKDYTINKFNYYWGS